MESEKLLPCPNPWCGETQEVEPNRNMWSGCWHVGCGVCMLDGPVMATEAEAIAAWNTRAPADLRSALEAEREADAFLVEWQQGGETWVHAHADEPTAVDQARKKGGTCTPLYRALAPTKGDVS